MYVGGLPTAETFALPLLQLGVSTYSSALFNFVPQWAIEFYDAVIAQDRDEVYRRLNEFVLPYLDIRDRTQGYAVSIVKGGLAAVGRPSGPVRPPLTDLRADEIAELRDLIREDCMTTTLINEVEAERAATTAAAEAFATYRATTPEQRGAFLDAIAAEIEADKDAIIEAAVAESHLPVGRITGEVGRTTGQLRMFADVVRRGDHLGVRIDPAMPDRAPLPRADIRQRMIPLGPVAVFGASNFPLAFSTAGGDTASALAAGCPVVVKGHPAHPRTGILVAARSRRAVEKSGLPTGTFTFLLGDGFELGQALVKDPRIKAVGFTGSRAGGLALVETASKRPEPIPVYAEMSSINPVVVLPGALADADTKTFAEAYVGSLTLGSGQFCTNPGLLFLPAGEEGDAFVAATAEAVAGATGQKMLTAGIADAYADGTGSSRTPTASDRSVKGKREASTRLPRRSEAPAELLAVADSAVAHEVFGASGVIVRYDDVDTLSRASKASRASSRRRSTTRPRTRKQRSSCCPSSSSRPAASCSTAGRPASRWATRWSTAARSPRRPTRAAPASAASRSSASSARSPTRTSPPTSCPRPCATTTRGD